MFTSQLTFIGDSATLRRFEKRVYITLPDRECREAIIKNLLKQNDHSVSDEQITLLPDSPAARLHQLSGNNAYFDRCLHYS